MHLDDAQLARLVDGELGLEAGSVRTHLAECADCRARAELAGSELAWLERRLRALDHEPPAVTAAALARRGAVSRTGWRWRWAAGVVLAVGFAGVAWAAPGSPLPGLVRRVAEWVSGGGSVTPAPGPLPEPPAEAGDAGIALFPGANLVIEFTRSTGVGTAAVELTEEAEVSVRGPGGAATFTAEEERLLVERTGSPAAFVVRIPRAAPRVEIRVGPTRLFLKDGDRISAAAPPVDGRYSLPLP